MALFSSYFKKKNKKHIYLAGWEVELNGDKDCQKFMATQCINKKTAYTIWSATELVFNNNQLVKVYDIDQGDKNERALKENECNFPYIDVQPHQIYELHPTTSGHSFLGGELPKGLSIPCFELPFQYIGTFSKSDEPFAWLPFDLHIVAPIYVDIDKLFVDYLNPMCPKVINEEELRKAGSVFADDIKPDLEIVFEKVFIEGQKSNHYENGVAHTGVPNWLQHPDIPICPTSKNTMKFLCQIKSDTGVNTKRANIKTKRNEFQSYFECLNFWGDGELYIFFEPSSKVACFVIQNT